MINEFKRTLSTLKAINDARDCKFIDEATIKRADEIIKDLSNLQKELNKLINKLEIVDLKNMNGICTLLKQLHYILSITSIKAEAFEDLCLDSFIDGQLTNIERG